MPIKPVIVAAKRTAIGSFLGVFKDVSAVDLGVAATTAILRDIDSSAVADVITTMYFKLAKA